MVILMAAVNLPVRAGIPLRTTFRSMVDHPLPLDPVAGH
jgi:hypothetical protein